MLLKLLIFYIYNDIGSGSQSVQQLEESLSVGFVDKLEIVKLSANDLLKGDWTTNAAAIFMPGGADLQYAKKLNGRGNRIIRSYVESGGIYVGICAGAYYASSYCDFHRGDQRPGYEVLGSRELSLYSGSAVGPVVGPYVYNSEIGARSVVLREAYPSSGDRYLSYVNGGCYFPDAVNMPNITVLYSYEGDSESLHGTAAIVEVRIGSGFAILSGAHFEYNNHLVNNPTCLVYRTNEQLCDKIMQRLTSLIR